MYPGQVILAAPGAPFLSEWLAGYKDFNDDLWDESSIRLPRRIADSRPGLVNVLPPRAFFAPDWSRASQIFDPAAPALPEDGPEGPRYALHLWSHVTGKAHLAGLNPGSLRRDGGGSLFERTVAELLSRAEAEPRPPAPAPALPSAAAARV
eukprot:tig00021276_g19892.t1